MKDNICDHIPLKELIFIFLFGVRVSGVSSGFRHVNIYIYFYFSTNLSLIHPAGDVLWISVEPGNVVP